MIVGLYTTADAVRATLGLTERELYDKQIVDLEVDELLRIELHTVYPDHGALKDAVDTGAATPAELHTWRILQQYVKYECAVQLLPQFQMLVTQKVSDGDAEVSRFTDDLQETIDRILAKRDQYLTLLNPDAALVGASASPFSLVQPSYDPVTDGPYESTG